MKKTTKRISLLFWLAIGALHLLVSALPAPGTCAPKLNNADWQILPLSQSSRVKGARLTELQTESPINASHGVLVVAQSGLSNPVIGLVRMLPGPESETAQQLEFDFVPAVERQTLARDFYQANTDWSDSRIASHLQGIDFSQPVQIVDLPSGTSLVQYQLPGGQVGNYFAPLGTPANQLGIYTSGLIQNSYSLTRSLQALQSTAAPAVDTWSMANFGWRIQTGGGGLQFFIPNGASAVGH